MRSKELQDKQILIHERSLVVSKEEKSFSQFIKEKRKLEKGQSNNKNITTRELASRLSIDYEMFRKILNMNKPTKKRDCIIAICAALRLDSEETNEALLLYQYMPTLDTNNPRDDLLIEILEEQLSNPLTIEDINQRLIRNGYPELDIIDHRPIEKAASERKDSPLKLIKKQVRTFSDDLFFGNQYESLDTQYDTLRYRCVADMWLEDEFNKKSYNLSTGTDGSYSHYTYSKEEGISDIKTYKTPYESSIFKDYFLELEAMSKREHKKMLSILNDTKNYQVRIGANILNDKLHVFVETYNYTVPELNEYYFFEYINNNYRLSVFNRSVFMNSYLSPEKYTELYGSNTTTPLIVYSSLEEIEKLKANSNHDGIHLLRYRNHMFKRLQNQVDTLLTDLRERRVFVRNLDYIYDDRDRVCSYFGVENEFQCISDSEYEDMMSAGIYHFDFALSDQSLVTITLDDLYYAFELGFNNIDEICRVKKCLGSIQSIIPK